MNLSHFLTDPQFLAQVIQSLQERVSRLEQQVADLTQTQTKAKETR